MHMTLFLSFQKPLIPAVCFLLCMMGGDAIAQSHYTSAVLEQGVFPTIQGKPRPVRWWKNNYSVSVVADTTSIGLCLIDHSAYLSTPGSGAPVCPTRIVSTPGFATDTNVIINDIFILGDTAYFCGSRRSMPSMEGFIGYVSLNDVLTGSAQIYAVTLNWVNTIRRLVAYRSDASGIIIAAIGDNIGISSSGTNFTKEVIIEVDDALSTMPTFSHASLYGMDLYDKEYIHDVLLTDNYVVFVGHNYNTTFFPTGDDVVHFRAARRGRFLFSGEIDIVHFIPNIYGIREANSYTSATALNKNEFAVAYIHTPGPAIFTTRLRVIDLNTFANTLSQQMHKPDKEDPVMMDFIPMKNTVIMLQEYNNPSDFLKWKPYSTVPYITYILTPPQGTDYRHVHNMANKHFIATSGPYIYMQDPDMSIPASNPSCPVYGKANVEIITEMPLLELYNPVITTSMAIPSSNFPRTVVEDTLKKNCYSVE